MPPQQEPRAYWSPVDARRRRANRRAPSRGGEVISGELAGALELIPTQVRKVRQRPRECPGWTRLHHAQMGAGCNAKARQLVGWDAPVGGYDQLLTRMFARCAHAISLLHSRASCRECVLWRREAEFGSRHLADSRSRQRRPGPVTTGRVTTTVGSTPAALTPRCRAAKTPGTDRHGELRVLIPGARLVEAGAIHCQRGRAGRAVVGRTAPKVTKTTTGSVVAAPVATRPSWGWLRSAIVPAQPHRIAGPCYRRVCAYQRSGWMSDSVAPVHPLSGWSLQQSPQSSARQRPERTR